MSVLRISAIGLGSLLLIASTMARTAPGPGDGIPVAPDPVREPPPAPAGPGGEVSGGRAIHHGGGGVGFSAPHEKLQLAVIKQLLKAGDDDWKTLSPKVEKVLAAKQNMSTGAGMNWTTRNDAKPVFQPSGAKPDTAPGKAMQAVRAAAADEDASDDQLARKMAAVREARKEARAQHEAAEKELLDALTPRQQAILMTLGVVE